MRQADLAWIGVAVNERRRMSDADEMRVCYMCRIEGDKKVPYLLD